MPAFKQREFSALQMQVHQMYNKHLEFEPCALTHQDMLELFVKPEDHDFVLRVGKLYQVNNLPRGVQFSFGNANFELSMRGRYEFAIPLYARDGFATSEVTPAREALNRTLTERLELNRKYALVRATLERITAVCETPSQVSFLWPAINVIASRLDPAPMHDKLAVIPKTIPSVDPALRQAIKETAETVAIFQMLGDPPGANEQVSISMTNSYSVKFETPLGKVSCM